MARIFSLANPEFEIPPVRHLEKVGQWRLRTRMGNQYAQTTLSLLERFWRTTWIILG